MKLNKDNGQKLFLAALLVFGGFYYYFSELLGPLSARETAIAKETPGLEGQIKAAKSQISRTRGVEASDPNAVAARECFDVMKATIPEDSSLAWLPQRLSDFFKRQGVQKASMRLNAQEPTSDIAGYMSAVWTIDIPRIEYVPLAIAIAGLENQEGLLQITNLQIASTPLVDEQYQHAQLTISTVVKK